MSVNVQVNFLGIYQRIAGKKSVQLKLKKHSTIRNALIELEKISQEFKQVLIDSQLDETRPKALILVDGKEISVLQGLETKVNQSEEITLIPMVHGG
ncbi:MAG: MoaD/ThiS family protein [Candidatus Bathyarchaeota archaeon]|nr:MoaD/ThiS family protein [Candidatus Bathyarchaeota archaeon]